MGSGREQRQRARDPQDHYGRSPGRTAERHDAVERGQPLLHPDAGLVTSKWRDQAGERTRRYYSITAVGRKSLAGFRAGWAQFAATVGSVLNP